MQLRGQDSSSISLFTEKDRGVARCRGVNDVSEQTADCSAQKKAGEHGRERAENAESGGSGDGGKEDELKGFGPGVETDGKVGVDLAS